MSLETDYTTVPGQVFACLSIVGPEAPQKNDKFGIKIRGAFATRDEAANHAKRLQKEDTTFDIYVVDMYKWLLIPPDSSKIEDVHYNNEKLEEIMSGYKDNQAQAARMFSERKQGMMKDKVAYAPGDDNSQFYTKPDEAPISHPADVLERLKKEKPDTPMEELVKEANVIVAAEVEERKKQRELEDVKEEEPEEASA
jgi:protease II